MEGDSRKDLLKDNISFLSHLAENFAFINYPITLKKGLGMLLLSFSGLQIISGQMAPPNEYQVKAVFLFNFAQFVEWPVATFSTAGEPFVIGILGDDPFGNYLDETIAGEQVLGHSVIVQRYNSIGDINNCQILFIGSNDPQKIKTALSGILNRSILTVSDTNDFTGQGGMIGFVTQENRIRLQIKPMTAKGAGLNISSKLLRLADIIE